MKVYRLAPKCYPKYFRKIKFDDETYWQRNSNLDTASLFEKEYTAIWHSTDEEYFKTAKKRIEDHRAQMRGLNELIEKT